MVILHQLYGHLDSKKYCNGGKEIISNISDMHLFFDILYWEGDFFTILIYNILSLENV